jgi:hypothetical protein
MNTPHTDGCKMDALKDPNLSADEIKLLNGLQGIQRIVINSCHGGFGLSEAAVRRYLELRGIEVWVEPRTETYMSLGPLYWLVPPGPHRATYDPSPEAWSRMTMAERQANNKILDSQLFYARDIARDDPLLVRVVEELGSQSYGRHAELKVVDVPSDVEWTIEEYDGSEWVAEVHRTWQ